MVLLENRRRAGPVLHSPGADNFISMTVFAMAHH